MSKVIIIIYFVKHIPRYIQLKELVHSKDTVGVLVTHPNDHKTSINLAKNYVNLHPPTPKKNKKKTKKQTKKTTTSNKKTNKQTNKKYTKQKKALTNNRFVHKPM